MTLRQLQYAILLSKEGSFSVVAEKLNITQPALSKQILSLENELGVKLFDRNCSPIALTPAGAHFIPRASEIVSKEEHLLRSMEQFKTGQAGQLVIGITPFRSSYLVSKVITEVKQAFPHIIVKLCESGNDTLRKEVVDGKYDFAVVNLPADDSLLDIRMLEPDRLVLVVPKALRSKIPTQGNTVDFTDCKDLPFVVVGEHQEMRQLFDKLCTCAGFLPEINAEVIGLTTAWSLAREGVGATLLPWQFISHDLSRDNVDILDIRGLPYSRQPAIVYRKGQYLSEAAKFTMELLMQYNKG